MTDIMKMVKSLRDSDWLIKGVTETIENETSEQTNAFIDILLYTLGVNLLENMLEGKRVIREVKRVIKAG